MQGFTILYMTKPQMGLLQNICVDQFCEKMLNCTSGLLNSIATCRSECATPNIPQIQSCVGEHPLSVLKGAPLYAS